MMERGNAKQGGEKEREKENFPDPFFKTEKKRSEDFPFFLSSVNGLLTRERTAEVIRGPTHHKREKKEEEEEKDWIPLFVLAIFVKGVKGEEMHATS